jgi:hypothetical protein
VQTDFVIVNLLMILLYLFQTVHSSGFLF